jgi:hypothetical protein
VIVRAIDMPAWVSMLLGAEILAKVEHQRGMANGGAAAAGCGDRTLYRRLRTAGLTGLTCFPQFAVLSPEETARLTIAKQRILASLTAAEVVDHGDPAQPRLGFRNSSERQFLAPLVIVYRLPCIHRRISA